MTVWDTCTLCPRLCRSACPVATGTAREAAVPTWIAVSLREHEAGRLPRARAIEAATLCTDCGACREHCHLHRPLPEALRDARRRLLTPPPLEPLQPIQGEGALVAVETDERPLASWLAAHLGRPVRRWFTSDGLGVGAIEHPEFAHRAARLAEVVGPLEVVVADGGVGQALDRAGVRWVWLHELVPAVAGARPAGSCQTGGSRPLACCGAAGPLARHHPEDARRVGELFLARAGTSEVLDTRCSRHLGGVADPVDRLRELVEQA